MSAFGRGRVLVCVYNASVLLPPSKKADPANPFDYEALKEQKPDYGKVRVAMLAFRRRALPPPASTPLAEPVFVTGALMGSTCGTAHQPPS